MDDHYSTVYGRFYRADGDVQGSVTFRPHRRINVIEGRVVYLRPIVASIQNGILTHNGTPGVSIPASPFGLLWYVSTAPVVFTNMLQSYPGDVISLGD